MPLLRRQKFAKLALPKDLRPDEEVFFCQLTGEIFRDYELFFERVILCNSLVWTCEVTSRCGLTYQEALQCEERARSQLQSISSNLGRILLHLSTMTHRSRLNHLNDDVFVYVKDRFFVGETVEFISNNQKLSGKILKVVNSTTKKPNVQASSDSDSDVVCLDDPPKLTISNVSNQANVDAVSYIVQNVKKTHTLMKKHLSRKKGTFTRDKCKLFLKQHCDPSGDGVWKVKEKFVRKFKLGEMLFTDYFVGAMPMFTISEAKKKSSLPKLDDSIDLTLTEDDLIRKAKELRQKNKAAKQLQKQKEKVDATSVANMSLEEKLAMYEKIKNEKLAEKQAQRDQLKKLMDEQRAQKKEDLAKEREKRKEEKRIQMEYLREYNKPRDDLLLDDLKSLPRALPVNISLDSSLLGDVLMILEYLNCFGGLFDVETEFPNGISLSDFCNALQSTSINGLYMDMIHFLLTVIIRLQEEEDIESGEDHYKYQPNINDIPETVQNNAKNYELVVTSIEYAQKPSRCFGSTLEKLQVDAYTITEILRLQLLGSCALSCNPSGIRFRYLQRGGYTVMDDVGLDLIQREKHLLKKLETENIFDFSPENKLKVLNLLVHQLLAVVGCRDMVDDCSERLRQAKTDLRNLQYQEIRRDKDEATHKYRRKLEERAKEVERARLVAQNLPIPDELKPKIMEPEPEAGPEPERTSGRSKVKKKEEEDIPDEINWDKVTPTQREKWKQIYKKKEKDLLNLVQTLQNGIAIYPLGRDRTFRRYWTFKSVPGLFIEDDERHVDSDFFDSLVPQKKIVNGSVKPEDSNKENITVDGMVTNGKPLANGDMEPKVNGIDSHDDDTKDSIDDKSTTVDVSEQISDYNKSGWSFYSNKEDVEKLIDSLNPRGYREGPLKTTLMECKSNILEAVESCPVESLHLSEKGTNKKNVRVQSIKSRNKNTQGLVQDGSATELMELSLREQLLDIEERIFVGTLGALKNIENREVWRSSLENGSYNPTGDPSIGISEATQDDGGENHAAIVVNDLSKALAQIFDSVESKYLNIPLGENDPKRKSQKKKLEANSCNNSNASTEASSSLACRWLASLSECTSLPQVFLHLSVLESSVAWSKSALHARCKLCRRKGDAEKMLLCDGCDRGHHMYCLKPPVKNVPRGDWFCPECKPKQTVMLTPRKNRRKSMLNVDEDSDEDSDELTADSDSDEENGDNTEDDSSISADSDGEEEITDDEEEDEEDEEQEEESQEEEEEEDSDSNEEESPKETKIKIFNKKASRKLDYNSSGRSTPTNIGRQSSSRNTSRTNSRAGTPTEPRSKRSRHSWGGEQATRQSNKTTRSHSASRSGRGVKRSYGESSLVDEESHPAKRTATSPSELVRDHMTSCKRLIKELTSHKDSEMFMYPVSKKDVPDYHDIIKRPMDLSTIRVRLNNLEYEKVSDLVNDIKQMFANCEMYNHSATNEYKMGQRLCSHFVENLKALNLHTVLGRKPSPKSNDANKRSSRR